jgi:hypothetical protein
VVCFRFSSPVFGFFFFKGFWDGHVLVLITSQGTGGSPSEPTETNQCKFFMRAVFLSSLDFLFYSEDVGEKIFRNFDNNQQHSELLGLSDFVHRPYSK